MPGDFDNDHDVDGADFLTWQKELGSVGYYPLNTNAADGNGDGAVDFQDHALLQANFGRSNSAGAQAVPEPAAGLLAAGIITLGFPSRRRSSGPRNMRNACPQRLLLVERRDHNALNVDVSMVRFVGAQVNHFRFVDLPFPD